MANGYTIFFTYRLDTVSGTTSGYGYNGAIHCNYINSIYLDSITNKEVNIFFNDVNDFKFLNSGNTGSGYTANRIHVIIQLINNAGYENLEDVKPLSNEWHEYDVTGQISESFSGFTVGQQLSPTYLCGSIFKVPLYKYYNNTEMPIYDMSYINYPLITQSGLTGIYTPLSFGDEQYFIGNVSTDIEAIAYTTDISIPLNLHEFNSSTNATWDGNDVYITEVGIYDDNNNLVAIGKLNDPLPKNSTITRTLRFALDF